MILVEFINIMFLTVDMKNEYLLQEEVAIKLK